MGVEVLQILSIGLVFLGLLIFLCFFIDCGIGASIIEALIVAVFGSLIILVLLFLSLATKEPQQSVSAETVSLLLRSNDTVSGWEACSRGKITVYFGR